jgi:hypothetical protein
MALIRNRVLWGLLAALALLMIGGLDGARTTYASTVIVNDTGDADDLNSGDGVCETGLGNGICTLRAAIEETKSTVGGGTIYFNIAAGAVTIQPNTILPNIPGSIMARPVVIDGRPQAGFFSPQTITLDGTNAGFGYALSLGAGNVVKGLTIQNFVTGGISIEGPNNVIGGPSLALPREGNTIRFNGGSGVRGLDTFLGGTGNAIRGNSIYSNGGLGIDIGGAGVTPDDLDDSDSGFNNLQNHGVLTSALTSGALTGYGRSAPNTVYAIDIFVSPACDGSGFGEGQTYLGAASGTTDMAGYVRASGTVPSLSAHAGEFVTITATDPAGNTSEFSNCVPVLTDSDGDGIENSIDTMPGTFSNDYFDVPLGGTTFGTILSRGGVGMSIVPSADASVCAPVGGPRCVIIGTPGSGMPASISHCSTGISSMSGGSLLVQKCGSVSTQVLAGPISTQLGTIMATLPTGAIATVTDTGGGTYGVTTSASSGASITVGGYTMAPNQTASVTDPDGDGRVNQVDGCPNMMTTWMTPIGDDDCDAFPSSAYDAGTMRAAESFLGTNPNAACAATTLPNDEDPDPWPMDNNDDRKAALDDILAYIPVYGYTGPGLPYKARYDLNADNKVGLTDILMFIPFFNLTCTP